MIMLGRVVLCYLDNISKDNVSLFLLMVDGYSSRLNLKNR